MSDAPQSAVVRGQVLPWFYGWNIIGVGLLFPAVTVGIASFSFTFWISPWSDAFGATRAELMIAFMLAQFGGALMSPVAGYLLDRYSIRAIISLGVLAFGLGFVLISAASAVWQIVVVYALLISASMSFAGPLAVQTLAAKWFRARRGLAIGWASVGTSLGGFVLPPVVTFLLLSYGWRVAHIVLGVAAVLVVVPIVWLVIRNTPEERGVAPEAEAGSEEGSAQAIAYPEWTMGTVMRESSFWIPVFGFIPAMAVLMAFQVNLGPYAQDLGISLQSTAFLMSVMAGAGVAGKLLFGAFADRFDHRILYGGAIGFLVLCLLGLLGQPGYLQLLVACGSMGFAVGGFLPMIGAILGARFGPKAFGQVIGLVYLFFTFSAVGGPIAGYVRDTYGSYDLFLQGGLVVAALSAVPMIWLKPPPSLVQRPA